MANLTTRNNGGLTRRRDPFDLLARDFFGWNPFGDYRVAKLQQQGFAPTFEVLERDDAFLLRADVPGVAEEDIDLSIHEGVLTINGSREAEEKKEGETYYLYERSYGSFSRSFKLPDGADTEKVDAKLADGVLEVTIGKKAESQPRKIKVSK